ncbi:MAG: bifunctional (p)ppGpp synthetase/guanosine-3',5'-bis(diphosphate) 3'-pyrophosphohydrolase [Candidatus Hydrogenedentes bacterium]|nr:bifunctional (p)ppGpp synthetase/guanosine-3',5'-bis(diphosphate) 3'-pyrophosphohydrolase [Candidatus Hydrogenedentota bacterium]
MRSQFLKLKKQLRRSFTDAELEVVRTAYRVAGEAHHGQTRLSGEPYIMHSLSVAQNLAALGLDPVTCAAGLLHDVLEDTSVTQAELQSQFGEEITLLVDGVTKISSFSFPDPNVTHEIKQAQNIRKMLVATAKDVRVILIKLADRLHNIRTLKYLRKDKRIRIARETLDIYAPMAHRLGISQWKWELEDHAFHHLRPDDYRAIARQVAMRRRTREAQLVEVIQFLEKRLAEAEVTAHVIGRPKHLYGIYQKMVQQGKDFHEVMDIQAIRIISQTEAGCYNALGAVHSLWTPIPGRLKDYIAMPKLNMYQAIHTTVMGDNARPLEIQIRSEEMDKTAREGIAAHWHYKEGEANKDKKLDTHLDWLRQMYGWLKDAHAPEELMDSMRRDFGMSHIYVFSPKGEVKELPPGATPLDFAYLIHSDVGHQCMGARVNGRMVPLRYHLQMGDVVEVLTSRNQTPHLDWVDIVVTGRARTRIRQRLRDLGMLPTVDDPVHHPDYEGDVPKTRPRSAPPRPIREVDEATRQNLVRIEGDKGLEVQFAKCCNPMPGHPLIGYITKKTGISVHRADCKSFAKSARDGDRIVEANWEGEGLFETTLHVEIGQRPNVLADLTNALRPTNIDILRAEYQVGEDGFGYFDFTIETSSHGAVNRIMRTLEAVTGVVAVAREKKKTEPSLNLAEAG